MISLKLALRNLLGAGLRTWLNVFVLSFSYVMIIWHRGFLDGWNKQARFDTINWEIGGGQYWHSEYDPYDPFTLTDSHSAIPDNLKSAVDKGENAAILVSQATIYPEGRLQGVILKGINVNQSVIKIPTEKLKTDTEEIPVLIGTRMAGNNKLNIGDMVMIRWRDKNGTFDAAEGEIVGIFKTTVPKIDNGQMWIPIEKLQEMLQLPGETTILTVNKENREIKQVEGWTFKGHDFLLSEMDEVIKTKKVGGSIFYFILLLLAMLAIFDTQILSIFRRQKEIGTYVALGMTRGQVISLFTVEGAMHSILAIGVAAVYGVPLLIWQAKIGFAMPAMADDYGLAITERIFPEYGAGLVIATILIVTITATIVSYMPARKIAKMNPTDAIKGKIQ